MAENVHATPPEKTCLCCSNQLNTTNYVEYRSDDTSKWLASGFCNGE